MIFIRMKFEMSSNELWAIGNIIFEFIWHGFIGNAGENCVVYGMCKVAENMQ